jgi:response regulator RpfG family c-di-GMP phosphodiesterase
MNVRARPQVLCVDDEPRVLAGLAALLRKEYDVHIATGGEQALQKLKEFSDLAVVVSDMRMPSMDGATFLHEVMQRCPDATRIVLTGEAGIEGAKLAVNKGQIFRFLTKPCPIDELKIAIDAAVVQHQLVGAERAVLQETLIGCIRALMEVLAIANPTAFGRANRIKRLAIELAAQMGRPEFWQLEAAALLSQLGYLSLPPALVEKIYYGQRLTPEEKLLAASVPGVAIKLLEHIPRMDPVIQILKALNSTDAQVHALGDDTIGLGTRMLGLVLEYDALTAQGKAREVALQSLAGRAGRFGKQIFEQLGACLRARGGTEEIELPLSNVLPGMIILKDVRTHLNVLLVPKGFEVTKTFLERITSFAPELLAERVPVLVPEAKTPATPKAA